MIQISELIHRYYDLNKVYDRILQEKRMCFEEQVQVCEFYNYASERKVLDDILKNKLTATNKDSYANLLENLLSLLQENISLYSQNRDLLENLPIKGICDFYILKFENQIARQEIKIASFRQRFNEANKSLESTAYENSKENEILTRTKYYNESKVEYQEQQEILQGFFLEHKQMQYQICKYNQSQFEKVYELSKFISQELSEEIKLYFDKGLIYSIYLLCNNNIFESANEDEYQSFFSFNTSDNILILKKNTQSYICYLIKFLSEYVQNVDSSYWVDNILHSLKIPKDIYEKRNNDIKRLATDEENTAKKTKLRDFYYKLSVIRDQIISKK